jgi:hypothetical protein
MHLGEYDLECENRVAMHSRTRRLLTRAFSRPVRARSGSVGPNPSVSRVRVTNECELRQEGWALTRSRVGSRRSSDSCIRTRGRALKGDGTVMAGDLCVVRPIVETVNCQVHCLPRRHHQSPVTSHDSRDHLYPYHLRYARAAEHR